VQVPEGGWFSLMMAGIYAYIMLLWYYGSSRKTKCAFETPMWRTENHSIGSLRLLPYAGWRS
jgi:K+ transporter